MTQEKKAWKPEGPYMSVSIEDIDGVHRLYQWVRNFSAALLKEDMRLLI